MAQNKLDRRNLLKVMCGSAAAVCGGVVGCGPAGDMVTKEELVQLPAVVEGRILVAIADFPPLQAVGGGLVGEARGMLEPLAITREAEDRFFVMRAVCTHMTCTLRFNQLNATLDCPCHGSNFDLDGKVLTGPATRDLTAIRTEFDGRTLGILI